MKKELVQLFNLSLKNKYHENLYHVNLLIRCGECQLLWGRDNTGRILTDFFHGEGYITDGKIYFEEQEFITNSKAQFEKYKIFYIECNVKFMNCLDLAENLFLLKKNSLQKIWLNQRAMHIQAESLFKQYELPFKANGKIENLRSVDRVLLSIIRAVGQGAKLLVLNNISKECSMNDIQQLKGLLAKVKCEGVSLLIYDTHAEYFLDISDCLVIMDHGVIIKKIIDKDKFYLKNEIVARSIIGNQEENILINNELETTIYEGDIQVSQVNINGRDDIDIRIQNGEIIYLVVPNTDEQSKLWSTLKGEEENKPQIELDGKRVYYNKIDELTNHRIAFWGDRKDCSELLLNLSVKDNILLPSLKRISKRGFYKKSAKYIFQDNLMFKDKYKEKQAYELSEKENIEVILYKWKLFHPRLLVMNNIISRVEPEMKDWITKQLSWMSRRGTSILLLETSMEDAIKIADRMILIRDGCMDMHWGKDEFNQISIEKILQP